MAKKKYNNKKYTHGGSHDNDLDKVKKGLKYVESSNGVLMQNPLSSATGFYGQLYNAEELQNMNYLQGVDRNSFASDTTLQNRLFEDRYYGKIPDVPGLKGNAEDLRNEYKQVLEDKGISFDYTDDEISALSNLLGRQGTREYFGNVLRDGRSLADVFPKIYGAEPEAPNKTPEEYLTSYRTGRDLKYGGQVAKYNHGGEAHDPPAYDPYAELSSVSDNTQVNNNAVFNSSFQTPEGMNWNTATGKLQENWSGPQSGEITPHNILPELLFPYGKTGKLLFGSSAKAIQNSLGSTHNFRGLGTSGTIDARLQGAFRSAQNKPVQTSGPFNLTPSFKKVHSTPDFNLANSAYARGSDGLKHVAAIPKSHFNPFKNPKGEFMSKQLEIPLEGSTIFKENIFGRYKPTNFENGGQVTKFQDGGPHNPFEIAPTTNIGNWAGDNGTNFAPQSPAPVSGRRGDLSKSEGHVTEMQDWYGDYINSPTYRERLERSGDYGSPEDMDEVTRLRYEALQDVTVGNDTDASHINTETSGMQLKPGDEEREGIIAHEVGHTVGGMYDDSTHEKPFSERSDHAKKSLSVNDIKSIEDRNTVYQNAPYIPVGDENITGLNLIGGTDTQYTSGDDIVTDRGTPDTNRGSVRRGTPSIEADQLSPTHYLGQEVPFATNTDVSRDPQDYDSTEEYVRANYSFPEGYEESSKEAEITRLVEAIDGNTSRDARILKANKDYTASRKDARNATDREDLSEDLAIQFQVERDLKYAQDYVVGSKSLKKKYRGMSLDEIPDGVDPDVDAYRKSLAAQNALHAAKKARNDEKNSPRGDTHPRPYTPEGGNEAVIKRGGLHEIGASENYSDIVGMRKLIYDKYGKTPEEEVTLEEYNTLLKEYKKPTKGTNVSVPGRYSEQHTPEDAVWLLNNIAMESPQDEGVTSAKYGGRMRKIKKYENGGDPPVKQPDYLQYKGPYHFNHGNPSFSLDEYQTAISRDSTSLARQWLPQWDMERQKSLQLNRQLRNEIKPYTKEEITDLNTLKYGGEVERIGQTMNPNIFPQGQDKGYSPYTHADYATGNRSSYPGPNVETLKELTVGSPPPGGWSAGNALRAMARPWLKAVNQPPMTSNTVDNPSVDGLYYKNGGQTSQRRRGGYPQFGASGRTVGTMGQSAESLGLGQSKPGFQLGNLIKPVLQGVGTMVGGPMGGAMGSAVGEFFMPTGERNWAEVGTNLMQAGFSADGMNEDSFKRKGNFTDTEGVFGDPGKTIRGKQAFDLNASGMSNFATDPYLSGLMGGKDVNQARDAFNINNPASQIDSFYSSPMSQQNPYMNGGQQQYSAPNTQNSPITSPRMIDGIPERDFNDLQRQQLYRMGGKIEAEGGEFYVADDNQSPVSTGNGNISEVSEGMFKFGGPDHDKGGMEMNLGEGYIHTKRFLSHKLLGKKYKGKNNSEVAHNISKLIKKHEDVGNSSIDRFTTSRMTDAYNRDLETLEASAEEYKAMKGINSDGSKAAYGYETNALSPGDIPDIPDSVRFSKYVPSIVNMAARNPDDLRLERLTREYESTDYSGMLDNYLTSINRNTNNTRKSINDTGITGGRKLAALTSVGAMGENAKGSAVNQIGMMESKDVAAKNAYMTARDSFNAQVSTKELLLNLQQEGATADQRAKGVQQFSTATQSDFWDPLVFAATGTPNYNPGGEFKKQTYANGGETREADYYLSTFYRNILNKR